MNLFTSAAFNDFPFGLLGSSSEQTKFVVFNIATTSINNLVFFMDSEDSNHKKPRMDEDKDIVEDVELIKVVSRGYFTRNLTNVIYRLQLTTTKINLLSGAEMECPYVPP